MLKQRDKENQALMSSMKDRDADVRELNAVNSDLKRKLDTATNSLKNTEHELERTEARYNIVKEENDSLKEIKLRLVNDDHVNNEAIKQRDIDLERLSSQLADLSKELASNKELLRTRENDMDRILNVNNELKDENEKIYKKTNDVKHENDSLKRKNHDLEYENKTREGEIERVKKQLGVR